MSNHRFTPKLLRTLKFIKKYQEDNGTPPTIAEIGEHFKINPTAAKDRVMRCAILGYVEVIPKKARAIRFTDSGLTKIKAEGDYYDSQR